MSSAFSASFPSWLIQPSIIANVLGNPFASLHDVPAAVNLSDSSLFMAGLRQALYWRRQLASSASKHTVIFSFLGVRGLMLPNILEVCKALKNVCNMSHMVEIYRALNSPFIGISFSDSSQSDLFQALCTSFNNSLVIYVSPSSSHIHHFRILGLPPLFPDSRVHHFINKHSQHHQFTRDLLATDDNISTPANSVSGTLQLAPDQDIMSLPHLIPLPAPHLGSALFVLSGRQSLCLKCGSLGHVRRSCPSVRCSSCHRFHMSSTLCSSSSLTPDHALLNDWISDDSSFVLQPSSSPVITASSSECDHTHHASPPVELSTPVLPAALDVSSSLNPAPIIHPMPPASNTSVLKHVSTYISSRCPTTSMTSDKSSSHASVSSKLDPASSYHSKNNIYDHLIDEVTLLSDDSSKLTSIAPSTPVKIFSSLLTPNTNSPTDASTLQATSILATTAVSNVSSSPTSIAVSSQPYLSGSLSSLPSHKRAKLSPSNASSSSSVLPEHAPPVSISSWADQADMEMEESATSSPDTSSMHIQADDSNLAATNLEDESDHDINLPGLSSTVTSPSNTITDSEFNLDHYYLTPGAKRSVSRITCSQCKRTSRTVWPFDMLYECHHCTNDLTYISKGNILPYVSSAPIRLTLTEDHFNHPPNVQYLRLCHSLHIPIVTLSK